jgi:very-short-patch-repair endonuclease
MRIGEIMRTMGLEPDETLFLRQGPDAKRAYADYLRENQTPTERMMARVLYHLGCDVEPQQPVLGWIVDFLDAENRVVIEVDGSAHTGREEADDFRDEKMREAGYRVIRIESWEVPHMLQQVARWRDAA